MTTSRSSTIRTDILEENADLLEQEPITVDYVYDLYVEPARQNKIPSSPLRTIGKAKELDECFNLIKDAIDNYDSRTGVTEDAKIKKFSFEDPSKPAELEAITIVPTMRLPGMISQGRPSKSFQGVKRELTYHLREEGIDPENHNYRLAVLGKTYDNWVDFTCWGRTNKAAFDRAIWFETLIEEYAWYFTMNGVSRIIIEGHKERRVKSVGDNIIYGYPVECYIRTEKIINVSEKALEQIIIKVGISTS